MQPCCSCSHCCYCLLLLLLRLRAKDACCGQMYDIFGKYGAIRQIRLGNAAGTKVCNSSWTHHVLNACPAALQLVYSLRPRACAPQGTAFVVYEDIYDAKNAYVGICPLVRPAPCRILTCSLQTGDIVDDDASCCASVSQV